MIDELKTRVTNIEQDQAAGPGSACLVLIYPTGQQMGRRYSLKKPSVVIGRGADCDIVVDLDSVSRRHASVTRRGPVSIVADLGSTNGTYVNQRQIKRHALADGDQIKIGNVIFKFLSGGNVEAGYHEAIYRMTIIDGLTEVYNKRYFLEFLDRELARSLRYQRPISLVIFDLDHFKRVNDTHGHLAGDHVLRRVARRLAGRIRKEELLARYGGEEFVVILPETGHEGAMAFAEQLRLLVARQPIPFEEREIPVTISLGVATFQGAEIRTEELVRRADDKLYEAKNSGRNCVRGEFFRG